ncbi:GNAT family N-acetyltransferase [Agromyces sp. Leaf222]|uniref:GNAT family N-acetyltransferase n=1 Tax=Agromyces sp. Leaf222 TaxID=1735688 RepID=UPI0009EAFFBD|nr:GNAT family N-acetyltransferase [Agromyces sp. Leaf222]
MSDTGRPEPIENEAPVGDAAEGAPERAGAREEVIEIERQDAARRYVVTVDGAQAGVAVFVSSPSAVTFTHTIVDPAFGGRGIGSRLAKFALDDTVARGLRIVPRCPFIAEYLRHHAEYEASVDWP